VGASVGPITGAFVGGSGKLDFIVGDKVAVLTGALVGATEGLFTGGLEGDFDDLEMAVRVGAIVGTAGSEVCFFDGALVGCCEGSGVISIDGNGVGL
jgi:hypothetical protein